MLLPKAAQLDTDTCGWIRGGVVRGMQIPGLPSDLSIRIARGALRRSSLSVPASPLPHNPISLRMSDGLNRESRMPMAYGREDYAHMLFFPVQPFLRTRLMAFFQMSAKKAW